MRPDKDPKLAHPDDADRGGSKYKLLVRAVQQMVKLYKWDPEEVAMWIDFACIDQDDRDQQELGIKSLPS